MEGEATVAQGALMQSSGGEAGAAKEPADRQMASASTSNGSAESGAASARSTVPPPDEDMASLMEISDQECRSLRRGEMLEGVVVSIDRDGILVDVGTKSEGVV